LFIVGAEIHFNVVVSELVVVMVKKYSTCCMLVSIIVTEKFCITIMLPLVCVNKVVLSSG